MTFVIALAGFFGACGHTNDTKATAYKKNTLAEIDDTIYQAGDNITSNEKVLLGRYLFYDRRLSVNNTKACASCHAQEFSFTDGYRRPAGAFGDLLRRNSSPLINIVFNKYLTSADSSIHFPEQQMDKPLFNTSPAELGLKGNENLLLQKLQADKRYKKLFAEAFPEDTKPVSIPNIKYSIASFVKSILSLDSPWDKYVRNGDSGALTASQKRGMQLFFSDRLKCRSCHSGINFSTPQLATANGSTLFYFNTGLYNINKDGAYPSDDEGLKEKTGQLQDMGKFRVPALRNLAFTAPYFHDGSAATIEEVIEVYEQGGRKISRGINAGDGRKNPFKNPLISGFKLQPAERRDLIAFLLSLSDSSVLKNPAYTNPFTYDETR